MTIMASKFLSTPSARRATVYKRGQRTFHPISIHPPPPRGARLIQRAPNARSSPFPATPPARRATAAEAEETKIAEISIHALREEGDLTLKEYV